jgi:hypothetical protein
MSIGVNISESHVACFDSGCRKSFKRTMATTTSAWYQGISKYRKSSSVLCCHGDLEPSSGLASGEVILHFCVWLSEWKVTLNLITGVSDTAFLHTPLLSESVLLTVFRGQLCCPVDLTMAYQVPSYSCIQNSTSCMKTFQKLINSFGNSASLLPNIIT